MWLGLQKQAMWAHKLTFSKISWHFLSINYGHEIFLLLLNGLYLLYKLLNTKLIFCFSTEKWPLMWQGKNCTHMFVFADPVTYKAVCLSLWVMMLAGICILNSFCTKPKNHLASFQLLLLISRPRILLVISVNHMQASN